jgi:FkbM family methyltransferase
MTLSIFVKGLLLDLAYKGEVAFSRLQGIAYDCPKRNGEYALIRAFKKELRRAFDIGANAGDWTAEVLAQTGGAASVLCVEADASNAAFISERFRDHPNVQVRHAAASRGSGTASFQIGKGERSGAGRLVETAENGTVEVSTVTLDSLAGRYPNEDIDLVKADIEGAEIDMLKGAGQSLRSQRFGAIQLEYNSTWIPLGRRMSELFDIAGDYGYSVLLATPIGFVQIPRYAIGLEDYRMRNFVLARKDRAPLLKSFGPCGRARIEASALA